MKARIEELVREAMRNAVCAGEPEFVRQALTTAVSEAYERAAGECAGNRDYRVASDDYNNGCTHCEDSCRKLKEEL